MQPYKGYFIEGNPLLLHPFSPDGHVGGTGAARIKVSSTARSPFWERKLENTYGRAAGFRIHVALVDDREGEIEILDLSPFFLQ
jgi:hypothetical protein